jgi:hypothetical protein
VKSYLLLDWREGLGAHLDVVDGLRNNSESTIVVTTGQVDEAWMAAVEAD